MASTNLFANTGSAATVLPGIDQASWGATGPVHTQSGMLGPQDDNCFRKLNMLKYGCSDGTGVFESGMGYHDG